MLIHCFKVVDNFLLFIINATKVISRTNKDQENRSVTTVNTYGLSVISAVSFICKWAQYRL